MFRNLELFRAGTYGGSRYTTADLDAIVGNFRKFQSGPKRLQAAPVVIGHEEADVAGSGVPKFGEVSDLRRDGDTLRGDLVGVDDALVDAIKAGRYDSLSAEIYGRPPEGFPGASGRVFRRLAILGGEIPRVKGLNPRGLAPALKCSEPRVRVDRISVRSGNVQVFSEEMAMSREEMIAALVAAGMPQEVAETLDERQASAALALCKKPDPAPNPDNFSERVERVVREVFEAKVKPLADQAAAVAIEQKRQRVDLFCENMVREGRVTPAEMDETGGPTLAARLMALDDATKIHKFSEGGKLRELTALDAEMRAIRNRPVQFKERVPSAGTVGGGTGGSPPVSEIDKFCEQHADGLKETGWTAETFKRHYEMASPNVKSAILADVRNASKV